MIFYGSATTLPKDGLAQAAMALDCEPAQLAAVLAVETNGKGFDSLKRPAMLFEPSVFYRTLDTPKLRHALTLAVKMGLAYPKWGTRPYPADSYPRMAHACLLDEDSALCSASWGIGQLMGGNFAALGYKTVSAMVAASCASEAEQLGQLVRFLQYTGLTRDLQRCDWTAFARGYNGPGQVARYAAELAAAYAANTTKVKAVA